MSNPKHMRGWTHVLASGDQIHVYSEPRRIILQLRRSVSITDDLCVPSFKVAVVLSPNDALALAAEVLTATIRTQYIRGHETQTVGEHMTAAVRQPGVPASARRRLRVYSRADSMFQPYIIPAV